MVHCAALGCNNRQGRKKTGITFHLFPKDSERRQLWIDAVKRNNWTPSSKSILCSAHFKEECMDRTSLAVVRIRDGAVPSIFEEYPPKEIVERLRKKMKSSENETDDSLDSSSPPRSPQPLTSQLLLQTPTKQKAETQVIENVQMMLQTREIKELQQAPKMTNENVVQNVKIKEEPPSDSSNSEINFVLEMVMRENKNYEESASDSNQIMPELSLQCLHDQKKEAELILPGKISVSNKGKTKKLQKSKQSNSLAFSDDWTVPHCFQIEVKCESAKKTDLTIYSEALNKLYTAKDVVFRIMVQATNVPPGCVIRTSAVFSFTSRDFEVVKRCPLHAHQDKLLGNPFYEHVIQSVSTQATYEKNPKNGRLSVVVPYEAPQNGEMYTIYGYKLTCFNSCVNGISRRPLMLLFTLENQGVHLGRQTLDVRCCACPMRDLNLDLRRYNEHNFASSDTKSEKESFVEEAESRYSLTVDDPNLYRFLNQMKVLYESSCYVKYLSELEMHQLFT